MEAGGRVRVSRVRPRQPTTKRVRPLDVAATVAYAQKVSYSTAGPPLTPGGLVTFMPHPNAMRASTLYQGALLSITIVRVTLTVVSGVPGLSVATAEPTAEPAAPVAPRERPRPPQPTRPASDASLLQLDLEGAAATSSACVSFSPCENTDDSSALDSSNDSSSSSSSSSASSPASADAPADDDGW